MEEERKTIMLKSPVLIDHNYFIVTIIDLAARLQQMLITCTSYGNVLKHIPFGVSSVPPNIGITLFLICQKTDTHKVHCHTNTCSDLHYILLAHA